MPIADAFTYDSVVNFTRVKAA